MKISRLLLLIAFMLTTAVLKAQYSPFSSVADFNSGYAVVTQSSTAYGLASQPNNHTFGGSFRAVWSTSFGGKNVDECYTAIQTSDGGYAMIGRANSFGAGNFDAWLIKTDASGNQLWQKTFGDSYIDEAYVIKETNDGGFIIGGMTTAFGNAGEGWLIRTDNLGNIIWNNAYHPMDAPLQVGWDYIYAILPQDDGSFIFGGVGAPAVGNMQAWTGKVDADGNLLWDNCFGGEYWERIFGMTATEDGGFAAVGDRHWTYDSITWQHDGWLLKFNADGDTTWTQHFGQVEHDIFRNVKQTAEGGYIICGESEGGMPMGFHGWIVCTDSTGNELWNKHLAKGGLYGVQLTGNTFTCGGTFVDPVNACEGWLVNIGADGNVNWESLVHGSPTDDMFLSLNPTDDGGLIGGGKFAQSADVCDYWLVKINADGPEALTYFYEDFDEITPPYLPEKWGSLIDVMLSNTVATIQTMPNGVTTSAPNAVFVMNGLDGSNGQADTTAFVALVTPYVKVLENGASLTFSASGGNDILVGTLTNPADAGTWTQLAEIDLTPDFTEYYLPELTPGEYYIAIKHANQSNVTPLFVDDIEFKQNTVDVKVEMLPAISIYPNPAHGNITLTSSVEITTLALYSLTGSELLTQEVSGKSITLQRGDLVNGVYFIKAWLKGGSCLTGKVVLY